MLLRSSTRPLVALVCSHKCWSGKRGPVRVSPEYLEAILRSPALKVAIDAIKTGIDDSGLNLTHERFLSLEIPVAPSAEQRRIVARIEALQERSRRAREALREVRPLLEQFRRSLLAAAFRGDLTADWRAAHPDVEPASELLARIRAEGCLGEPQPAPVNVRGIHQPDDETLVARDFGGLPRLPTTWQWTQLSDLCQVQGGFAFKSSSYCREGIPLVRIGDLNNGRVSFSDSTVTLPVSFLEQFGEFRLKRGDVLIAMSGATTGKTATYDDDSDALLNQRVGRFVLNTRFVAPGFIKLLIRHVSEDIRSRSYGGAQPNISPSRIASTLIACPPLKEQVRIVSAVELATRMISNIDSDHDLAGQNLEILDQSILAKAFRGELVPQNPNDEPASVLLDRIRAAREAAGSNGSTKRGRGRKGARKP